MTASLLRVAALTALAALYGAGSATSQQPDSLAAQPSSARILPGDRIALKVWREPTLSDALTVDQNGMVVLPRLGSFSLAQLTVGSLQDSIRMRYAEFLRNPSIEVTVLRRVGVHGEVKSPTLYWVDITTTLREVIALAGGLTEIANINNVVIVRGSRAIRIGNWERGGPLASDLLSGDQIVVGRTSWLSRNALAAASTVGVVASILITALKK